MSISMEKYQKRLAYRDKRWKDAWFNLRDFIIWSLSEHPTYEGNSEWWESIAEHLAETAEQILAIKNSDPWVEICDEIDGDRCQFPEKAPTTTSARVWAYALKKKHQEEVK